MIEPKELVHSPHQEKGLQALLSRKQESANSTPEESPLPKTAQTNLPADHPEPLPLSGDMNYNDLEQSIDN